MAPDDNILQFLRRLTDPETSGLSVADAVRIEAIHLRDQLAGEPAVCHIDPHHARVRLALANLVGAVSALANAIRIAGGYRVADPAHRERLDRAMAAVSNAHAEAMALPHVTDRNQPDLAAESVKAVSTHGARCAIHNHPQEA